VSVWRNRATWRYRVQRAGRVIAGSARSRQAALDCEAAALRDLHARRIGAPLARTVADALTTYLASPEFAKLKAKRRVIGRLDEIRQHLRGEAIEDGHLVADRIVSAGIKAGHSPYTTNATLRILRRVLWLARRKWDWPARPEKLQLLPETQRQTYLTQPEAKALLKELVGDARAWCALAMYAGLRAGEIAKLQPENVAGDLIVLDPETKTRRPRTIPVLAPAKSALARLPLTLGYSGMQKQFRAARTAIGRPEVRFHDLRHSYASWLAQTGATSVDIRDLLGHTQISTTDRYMHLSADRLREATSRIVRARPARKGAKKPRKAA
jgi:integrase